MRTFVHGTLALGLVLSLAFPQYAHGLQSVLMPPFGGLVVFMWPCTCGWPGWAIVVTPPVPTSVYYVAGLSLLYAYWSPVLGAWVLGQEMPFDSCRFWIGVKCITFPTRGAIFQVGTSIPGGIAI